MWNPFDWVVILLWVAIGVFRRGQGDSPAAIYALLVAITFMLIRFGMHKD